MLIEMRIRDYAVIDDLSLELGPGLTVLSGETGAGKSIIVGALSLLLGERASSDVVRAGAERAVVEGVFDVSGHAAMAERVAREGIEAEDGLLILRREVALEGRNRAWVNGSAATATLVGELGAALVDLHGQHEHQTLLRPDDQRAILDAFAGSEALSDRVRELHGDALRLEREREARQGRIGELESRGDFLRFQLREIQEAAPDPDEEPLLEDEARRLQHSEELARETARAHEALYAGEGAVAERLAELRDALRRLARVDPTLEAWADLLEEAYHAVAEVGRALGDYSAGVEHDPDRLAQVRGRQDQLFRLKRKYGPGLEDVLATAGRVAEELAELDGSALDLQSVERRLAERRNELRSAAGELSAAREAAARRLASEVEELLPQLGMPGACFRVVLTPLERLAGGGAEKVEFLSSVNPGFEPRALSRIASGGELSRVMLALKAILARVDRVPTLVFDEIDAGIGGVVAGSVAAKLRDVAEHHQVFVVTHLPQLASRAHRHFRVEKLEVGGKVATRVADLSGEDRVREVARMLGGDPESAASREHARELLTVGATS